MEEGLTISVLEKTEAHGDSQNFMKRTSLLTPNPWQEIGGGGCTEEEE